ncbi:MAG: UDP-N-acetylmuramoyl-L-alanyl-D-glutamate--2,6-diaminopimelate ligase [Alphaproteobacteria bacterium]|nr:UDP-N-acetylmuramoyl-L-alanyl-D-glutamate--2,6-diaminopimelate ligase [Alphaproteobacteria bacterium]
MRLSEVVDDTGMTRTGEITVEITGLTSDSRLVEPGHLFAALPGSSTDGSRFIADAAERGAVAVLAEPAAAEACAAAGLPLVADVEPRRRYAYAAARFFAPQPRIVAAVTGTNGKTSVVAFLRQIWERLGEPAASLGTLGVRAPGFDSGPSLTTPEPAALHATLQALAKAGIEHVALEASSHGLAQHRCDGVVLSAAAFTNLSRDHLDYHGDEDSYMAAKARLFGEVLPAGGCAVVNTDDAHGRTLAVQCRERGQRLLSFGTAPADLALSNRRALAAGQCFDVSFDRHQYAIETALLGNFQAGNLLCAAALAIACGDDPAAVFAALPAVTGAPGRLQTVARDASGGPVVVDYAHTPDALRAALGALRPHVAGRLHLVFGCGGDRDAGKRPMMGAIAAEGADTVIVTDDNPRGEDAAAIRNAVLAACPGGRDIGNRADAIETAIADMAAGDAVLIAGKGHERMQIVGDGQLPFDDAEVARQAMLGRGGEALP